MNCHQSEVLKRELLIGIIPPRRSHPPFSSLRRHAKGWPINIEEKSINKNQWNDDESTENKEEENDWKDGEERGTRRT